MLARNPEVQEKLFNEIMNKMEQHVTIDYYTLHLYSVYLMWHFF
jgi:hypothetical protein